MVNVTMFWVQHEGGCLMPRSHDFSRVWTAASYGKNWAGCVLWGALFSPLLDSHAAVLCSCVVSALYNLSKEDHIVYADFDLAFLVLASTSTCPWKQVQPYTWLTMQLICWELGGNGTLIICMGVKICITFSIYHTVIVSIQFYIQLIECHY